MGNWKLTIEGMGAHHNGQSMVFYYADEPGSVIDIMAAGKTFKVKWGDPQLTSEGSSRKPTVYTYNGRTVNLIRWEPTYINDANILFREFVDKLIGSGHTIYGAKFECLGSNMAPEYVQQPISRPENEQGDR